MLVPTHKINFSTHEWVESPSLKNTCYRMKGKGKWFLKSKSWVLLPKEGMFPGNLKKKKVPPIYDRSIASWAWESAFC